MPLQSLTLCLSMFAVAMIFIKSRRRKAKQPASDAMVHMQSISAEASTPAGDLQRQDGGSAARAGMCVFY